MNPFFPRTLASGDGGTITTTSGLVIGKIGDWAIQTFGDDMPFLTARGCEIGRLWLSAGVQEAIARPRLPLGAKIEGRVSLLDATKLNMGTLTITGIPGLEQRAD